MEGLQEARYGWTSGLGERLERLEGVDEGKEGWTKGWAR